ncbi:hypothetical protein ZEAMMB73_Zm00001d042689 [Zea mays]|uniref:Uncharacterized protein n=1 Tax=Zea mays TaxID=4577 RepID=A0A1D6N638_MAIZE|nr:hypothetical protein ZEAMMB73_Zm00001d042689 [Zea mays]
MHKWWTQSTHLALSQIIRAWSLFTIEDTLTFAFLQTSTCLGPTCKLEGIKKSRSIREFDHHAIVLSQDMSDLFPLATVDITIAGAVVLVTSECVSSLALYQCFG